VEGPQIVSDASRTPNPTPTSAPPVSAEEIALGLDRADRALGDYRLPYDQAVYDVLVRAAREAAAAFVAYATDHLTAAAAEPPPHPGWAPPALDELLPEEAMQEWLRTATDPIRRRALRAWLGGFARDVEGIRFDLTSPWFGAVIGGAAQHVTDITDTTRIEVAKLISEAYKTGMGIPATADLIRSAMTTAAPARADAIARTELNRVANGAAVAGVNIVAAATGQRYTKVWLTAEGADYPRHATYAGLDGQTRELAQPFDVGGYPADYPGDANLPPEESVRCRCTVVFREVTGG
jgi:hypothetical protein